MTRIFVTQPLAGTAIKRLRSIAEVEAGGDASRILPRERLLEGVGRCDVLCCLLHDRVDAEVIDAAPGLRLIACGAVVPANVDLAHATRRGVAVTVIPNFVAETTADLQWGLLMAVARRIPEADRQLRTGVFPGSQSLHFAGGEVHGRTLGTVGLGAIGRGIATRAQGFGMRVVYTKRNRLTEAEEKALGVEYRPLDDILRESDFVALNASYHPGTHHLIGEREIGLMKPSAYLINTARGPMVDEKVLARALSERRIAGAALDVYEQEPRVSPELLGLDNVVLTPHIGSATLDVRVRIATVIVDNVEAFLRGATPSNIVNPEVLRGERG